MIVLLKFSISLTLLFSITSLVLVSIIFSFFLAKTENTFTSLFIPFIFTASFSEDGLSYSNKTPLGITAQKDEVAWGVPDAVVMPNGLVRVYWVYTEDRTSPEKIVSATSKTEKGIEFTLDPGYRVDNGYVDFEVLKAEDGDWQALMSYTPHYLPSTPQSLFYATSKDGLTWEFSEERITPRDYSYLDPTGIPIDDKSYLIVMGGAPNAMGDREYQLFTAELILP